MKKFIIGAVTTFGVLYLIGDAHDRGYKEGVDDTMKMLDFANKVVDTVKKTKEEA